MPQDSDHQDCPKYSLQQILDNHNEQLLFYRPHDQQHIHPHHTCLTWLIGNILPKKIIILDNEQYNTQSVISNLLNQFELSSQCYGNIKQQTSNSAHNSIIPLDHLSSLNDSLIYFNSAYISINDHPTLSSIIKHLPTNSILIFSNVYEKNSISKENQKLIDQWQTAYLNFEFNHHGGLLIIYTGTTPPPTLHGLFNLKNIPKLAQRFKTRCAIMDEYWQLKALSQNNIHLTYKKDLLEAKSETNLLEQQLYFLQKQKQTELQQLQNTIAHLTQQLGRSNEPPKSFYTRLKLFIKRKLQSYTVKKIVSSNRFYTIFIPKKIRQYVEQPASNIDISSPTYDNNYRPRRITFVAGEPHTPGVIYRCYRNAQACRIAGHEAKVINAADVGPQDIKWADIMILWRVEFSGHILGIVELAKQYNTLTAFDADDIVFKPQLAYIEIIDGIRSIGTTEAETSRTFGNMKQTLMRTDFAVATTAEMREHMAQELIPKHAGPLVFTLPNIFDDECVQTARFAARMNKLQKNDTYIRIGYASGTRTHQRDFALVIPALISVFKKRPQVRLVLFREPENHRPILHMNEYPELQDYENHIEWRDTVPLQQLPQELARFDISIAPLEADNVFCNAKSELKYFEAALANVCSVVSPTGPLKRCIEHGVTGFLANTTQEWEKHLITLIDNPELRHQVAQNAYHDVLWNFGIQRQSKLCDTIFHSLTGEKGAAQAVETMINRGKYRNLSLPTIPESEILFDHDALRTAMVTVIITSYNYSQYIIEAMESVKAQTLQYLDMIIVDDGSSDDSIDLILAWANNHKNRFNRLQLHRSVKNAGLGGARNIGIAASETLYSMQLDADNRLLPDTCEKLLAVMQDTAIGYAYPQLRHFGAGESIGGHVPFHPLRLTVGNYIDAMVMLAKWAWAAAGGFYVQRDAMGWEDYDMWCRLAELGIQGTQVLDAFAEYRAHFSSMTTTVTEQTNHKPKVVSHLSERHPWIDIVYPEDSPWYKKK
ncbi:glycosyltransferase [Commensalibacter oyaizuii]|uniref:Glycosyltransferase n=1 Tax=Commensalibacter oyaizuii TaxID=3043873 RepID=A0ABT6Q185_9PROT|nr:glycosyltransferase [Commensalibacter sp. TBRC 16381]MDI2090877.1 glycosyltransferase [Commensalibacter sp. TBRC 16381]